jgi:protein O-GlcNAc transferase
MDMGQCIQQAVAQAQGGRMGDAIALMESAVGEHPDNAHGLGLLGTLLSNAGRHAEAIDHLRKAHELAPQAGHIAYYLGLALVATEKPLEGLPFMQKAIDLNGSWLPALLGFAKALRIVGDFDRSEAAYRRALALDPKNPEVHGSLAAMLIVSGRVAEAVELFRRSALQHPNDVAVFARLTSALNYAGDATPEEIFEAHEHWGRLVMAQGSPPQSFHFDNARDPAKRLRVGFLSTDLWEHSCAYYLRPILQARDSAEVEFICYSAGGTPDWMTAELKAAADGWHDVVSLDHAALVNRLRADRLDILVELNGHTANGPLTALRNRAAPVQATYLGYPNTTGLPTIDYRIVDDLTDPAPRANQWCTEKLIRLDGCFLCYSPPPPPPNGAVSSSRRPNSPFTFGTFNSIRKLGPEVVKLWSRILQAVPGSRLLIKTRGIGTPAARRNFHTAFAAEGVEVSRVELVDGIPDKFEHLALYERVDIGLDTFPYNGTTTTCEAMWMGVPVIALEGNMHAGRVGVSLLHAVGLSELVARNQDEYLALAVNLAKDPARLSSLKQSMRSRMQRSSLCDAASFAPRFETALRNMWRHWCGAGGSQ